MITEEDVEKNYRCRWCMGAISKELIKMIAANPVYQTAALTLECESCESKYYSCDYCGEPVLKSVVNPDKKPLSEQIISCDKCKAGHFMCYVDKGRLR